MVYIYNKKTNKYFLGSGEGATLNRSEAYEYKEEDASFAECNNNLIIVPAGGYKILIIGDARHGKDTVAEIICKNSDFRSLSSSIAALDIFLFDVLNGKYELKYNSKQDAFKDRVNHRDIWYSEICEYNRHDSTRLVKDILKKASIYIGLRNSVEIDSAIKENLFDYIIGVYDYRKKRESLNSNTANVFKYSDLIINNNGTLEDLEYKVKLALNGLYLI